MIFREASKGLFQCPPNRPGLSLFHPPLFLWRGVAASYAVGSPSNLFPAGSLEIAVAILPFVLASSPIFGRPVFTTITSHDLYLFSPFSRRHLYRFLRGLQRSQETIAVFCRRQIIVQRVSVAAAGIRPDIVRAQRIFPGPFRTEEDTLRTLHASLVIPLLHTRPLPCLWPHRDACAAVSPLHQRAPRLSRTSLC